MNRLAIVNGDDGCWAQDLGLGKAILQAVNAFPMGRFAFEDASIAARELTFKRTYQLALSILANLRVSGHGPGDRVILDASEPEQFIPALWATLLGGMIAVPMVPSAWSASRNTQFRQRLEFVTNRLNGFTVLSDRVELFNCGGRLLGYSEVQKSGDLADVTEFETSAPAVLILTSGTTGRSQLVTLSRRAIAHRWFTSRRNDQSTFLGWMPLEHVMGLGLSSPNHSLKIHMPPDLFVRQPTRWLDLVSKWGVTHAGMTNFGMKLIVEAAENLRDWNFSALERVGVGADAISPDTCVRFHKLLVECGAKPDVISLGYGLSECGPVAGGRRSFALGDVSPGISHLPIDGPTDGHSIRIVDEDGQLCLEGVVGKIEVIGRTMASGYFADLQATSQLFTPDGWLRTGDIGVLKGGTLTVVGREKDVLILNARKYPITEIENFLEKLPFIRSVYAFPLAGAKGEQTLAIAYVASQLTPAIEGAIRHSLVQQWGIGASHCFSITEADVPRTATGKLQRSKLAEMFSGVARTTVPLLPASSALQRIALILSNFLGGRFLGGDDDFFQMGGDSLSAMSASMAIEREFEVSLPPAVFASNPTPRAILKVVEARVSGVSRVAAVPVRKAREEGPSLFLAPGLLGSNGYALHFSRSGFGDQGVWTFHLRNASDAALRMKSLEEFADECVKAMLQIRPRGPYHLLGHSFGGLLAYAMGCRLRELGYAVSTLAIVDAPAPVHNGRHGVASLPFPPRVAEHHSLLAANFVAVPSDLRVSYFRAKDSPHASLSDPCGGWNFLAAGGVDCYEMPGDHQSIVRGINAEVLAHDVRGAILGRPAPHHVAPLSVSTAVRALLRSAFSACRMGLVSKEIADLQLALSMVPDFPYWGHVRLARSCLAIDRLDEGIRAFRNALERDPWPLGTRATLIGLLRRCRLASLCEESLAYADSVEVTCAADAFGKYRIFREFGAWRFAEKSLVQGLSVAPQALDLRVELVRALAEQGQSKRAVDEIRMALATSIDNNLALRDLGVLALRVGAPDLAEECFRRSLAIDPDEDPRMIRFLEKVARRKGNLDEAKTLEAWASSLSSGGSHQVFRTGS
ncbi:AMP-binding protein [Aestuariivirga sp.]|jgi:acyl-CoA synthetase (AMP-forming)/AMP-acid ligase II/thioesterase domain-containing protein/acyl carrier protein|uniref:AMP-binding protein n=1 Tax=Aestuariivirga sp. TaxID=2650926 RepID=UPI003784D4C0